MLESVGNPYFNAKKTKNNEIWHSNFVWWPRLDFLTQETGVEDTFSSRVGSSAVENLI